MKICALVGSLRSKSYNRGLVLAAIELGKPYGLDIEIFERMREIPPYDADLDNDEKRPEPVNALKSTISDSKGLIIATPEYNYSIPGVLKNAIDWASRPPKTSPLTCKPAAIMGASTGISGTIRAQLALRQVFVFSDTFALLQPEVLIPKCADRFDGDGNLTDQSTRDLIGRQMRKLKIWIDAMEHATNIGATEPA